MPDAVFTTAGKRQILGRILQADWSQNFGFFMSIFTNNVTPTIDSVLTDFNRSGFPAPLVELTSESWQIPTLIGDRWRSFSQDIPFEFTAVPQTVTAYGYVVYDPFLNLVLWAQKFDTPVPLTSGQVIRVWPYFDYGQCP